MEVARVLRLVRYDVMIIITSLSHLPKDRQLTANLFNPLLI